jgi:hypothetical protein
LRVAYGYEGDQRDENGKEHAAHVFLTLCSLGPHSSAEITNSPKQQPHLTNRLFFT